MPSAVTRQQSRQTLLNSVKPRDRMVGDPADSIELQMAYNAKSGDEDSLLEP